MLPQGNFPRAACGDYSPFASGDAQPVFFYNPEKLQPARRAPDLRVHHADRMPVLQFSELLLPQPVEPF
jgi:hypothetical protein